MSVVCGRCASPDVQHFGVAGHSLCDTCTEDSANEAVGILKLLENLAHEKEVVFHQAERGRDVPHHAMENVFHRSHEAHGYARRFVENFEHSHGEATPFDGVFS